MEWRKARWWGRTTKSGGWAQDAIYPPVSALASAVLSMLLLLIAVVTVVPTTTALAAPAYGLAPDASCSALAQHDPSSTNGDQWGRTILPGHGKTGGWFGVDVCANGINSGAPNGANVSCDRVPANWNKTGCAPGGATSDGYGLSFQCVELVIRFSAWAFGDSPSGWGRSGWGNAPDLWLPGNHPDDFVMYPNGSDHAPVPGDILVWGQVDARGQPWPAGADGAHGGHIGVVAAVKNGEVITAEQNVKWGDQDHPSDRLALQHVGNAWILSGSIAHETRLPTYRWRPTMGTSRATYGWLHSTRNTGKFPATTPQKAVKVSAPAAPQTPRDSSGALPSLAATTVVTTDGALADLTWSTNDRFATTDDATKTASATAQARARSLGAPTGVQLAAGQKVASVVLPSGVRDAYVAGLDGHLYQARTSPRTLGVQWYDLGAPEGVSVQPNVSATAFAGGLAVAALGSDGNLWWRAGPEQRPGGWQPLDHPHNTTLAGGFALVGAPGSGAPLVLATGSDGRLYERLWQDALVTADGAVQAPAGWSEWLDIHAQPSGGTLTSKLLTVSETANARAWLGTWADAPVDVLLSDTSGSVWWLRTTNIATGWKLLPVATPAAVQVVLGAVAVADAATPASTPPTPSTPSTKPAATPTPAGTATASQSATKAGAGLLQVYVMAKDTPYLGALHVPQAGGGQVKPSTWTTLAPMPSGTPGNVALAAFALAPAMSAVVSVSGDTLLVGGSTDATQALGVTEPAQAAGANAKPRWAPVGTVVAAPAFDDALATPTLDARWSQFGAGARTVASPKGTSLVAGAGGAAALLQSAAAGDSTVAVRVGLPPRAPAGAAHAGLVLYLDDSGWVTLLVDASGNVQLCAAALQQTMPCVRKSVVVDATAHAVWMRIVRRGTMYMGESSTDGTIWHVVGQWQPVLPPAAPSSSTSTPSSTAVATPSPSPRATVASTGTPTVTPGASGTASSAAGATDGPVSPLAFTEWGLYVDGASGGFLLRDFAVSQPLGTASQP